MLYNPQLDTLIAVVETGSFTKASNELFISPQAVIKQINQLEERLGFTLFERTQRGVKLT
ncbi:MAG: LysR family transcriptional regulator, partial [Veillonella sp.]|nr:LysR family transcriptional regulator [Veillonella sp.]